MHRLLTAVALAASLVLLTAPGAPGRALARSHGSSCRHPASRHSHRRSCVARTHKRGGQAHRSAKRRHAARSRSRTGARKGGEQAGEGFAGQPRASCEDGSEPVRVGDETFECTDGSEPRCEAGSTLALAADGSGLVCEPALATTPPEGAWECEDGPASACSGEPAPHGCSGPPASADGGGPTSCEGGPPGCEEDSGEAQPGTEPAGTCPADDEGGEGAADARQRPAATRSQAASGS